jgi:hypothetical protein
MKKNGSASPLLETVWRAYDAALSDLRRIGAQPSKRHSQQQSMPRRRNAWRKPTASHSE